MAYKITLSDGTKIAGLDYEGGNFISANELTKKDFEGKLARITITNDGEKADEGVLGDYTNMKLLHCIPAYGKYYFALAEISAAELKEIETAARLDYLEMINDVEA